MRIAFQIVAILETARLALVDIDRHQARRYFAAHDAPFAPRRETRAAETAQAGVFHFLDGGLDIAFAAGEIEIRFITATGHVVGVIDVVHAWRFRTLRFLRLDGVFDLFQRGVAKGVLPNSHRRRIAAAADARRGDDTHLLAQNARQPF